MPSVSDFMASRRPRGGGGGVADFMSSRRASQQPDAEPQMSWFDTLIGTGLRVGGGIAGGLAAGALATPETFGLGTIPAAMAGGAAGSAGGELLAEEYEKARGLRDEISPGHIAIEGAVGAIPIARPGLTIGRAALEGAGVATLGSGLHESLDTGKLPDPVHLGLSAGLGGLLGAGGEYVSQKLAARGLEAKKAAGELSSHELTGDAGPAFPGEPPPPRQPGPVADWMNVHESAPYAGQHDFDEHVPSLADEANETASLSENEDLIDFLTKREEQRAAEHADTADAFSRVIGIGDEQLARDAAERAAERADQSDAFSRVLGLGDEQLAREVAERGERAAALSQVADIGDSEMARQAGERAEVRGALSEATGVGDKVLAQQATEQAERKAALQAALDRLDRAMEAERLSATPDPERIANLEQMSAQLGESAEPAGDLPPEATDFQFGENVPEAAARPRAKRNFFPAKAAAEAQARDQALFDLGNETDTAAEARRFLHAVRDAGGLDANARDAGGEGSWLSEFRDTTRFENSPHGGTVGGVANVIRQSGGKDPDSLVESLVHDFGYNVEDVTPANIHEKIADAMRAVSGGFRSNRGAISNEVISAIAGGGAGAAAGATQGDTPEQRAEFAVLGGLAGAGGGATLARFLGARAAKAAGQVLAGDSAVPGVHQTAEHRVPGAQGTADTAPGINRNAKVPGVIETPTGSYSAQAPQAALNTATGEVRKADDNEVMRFLGGPIPETKKMPEATRRNLRIDTFPEEQRPFMEEMFHEFGDGEDLLTEAERQRRGVQTNARTEALANHMAVSLRDQLRPGTALNAAGQRAYSNVLTNVQDQLVKVRDRIKETGGSDFDLVEQGRLYNAWRTAFLNFYGVRGEAGRSLQIHRVLKRVAPHEVALVRELLDRGRLRAEMMDLSDVMANLDKDPVKAFEQLRGMEQKSLGRKVADYYMGNILSGIKTQERNFFGNASKLVSRLATKVGTGGLDALSSMVSGKERSVYANEVAHEVQGGVAAWGKAMEDFTETIRLGFSPTALREGLQPEATVYLPKQEMWGAAKNPLNWPGRFLEATDRMFRTLNSGMEMYGLTYNAARKVAEREKLTGAAYDNRVADLVTGMRLNPSAELEKRVRAAGERAVFQEDPGAAVNMLIGLKKQVPALTYVIPFVRTVSNIFKQGAEHTPLGFIMERATQSKDIREQTIARGEAAMGTMALLPIAYYAATGNISGSGPTDPGKRAALYESGWRPNSIRVGDKWVSYTLAQPFSIPLSVVANGFEAWQEAAGQATEKSRLQHAESVAAETIARIGKSALDQSFLSGLGDLVKALNDPERSASGFFARLATGFVPLSGMMRNVAQAVDPVVRQPEGVAQSVATGIPGASLAINPRLNRFGEASTRERQSALVVPEVSSVSSDPVANELTRLGLDIGLPTDRVGFNELAPGKRQITEGESFGLRQTRGRATRVILSSVMKMPGYEGLPDALKADLLRRALRSGMGDVNDVARMAIQANRPDMLKQLGDPLEDMAASTYAR